MRESVYTHTHTHWYIQPADLFPNDYIYSDVSDLTSFFGVVIILYYRYDVVEQSIDRSDAVVEVSVV